MADSRVELNLSGINALMSSAGFAEKIQDAARAVASQASTMSGEDYGSSVKAGRWVAIGNVFPDSAAAAHDNYENNTLEKAVGAVGLNRHKGGRHA